MEFSAMTLNMFVPSDDSREDDQRIIQSATEQSIRIAELGYNPWYTDHHFRGPWHSNPLQFAAYIVPQIPAERFVGFGVLSVPFYHPLRLVESMNLLDQMTKGRALFGLGSGWQGTEARGLGVDPEYHASGRAAEDSLDVMQKLWSFRNGDPEFSFEVGSNQGIVKRRVMPSPYRRRHPLIIRTASREASLIRAARNGWPAFLGIFGGDIAGQARLYRAELEQADHPQDVVDECLRWCTTDWLSVCVADTDEEARARGKLALAEQLTVRKEYIGRHGKMDGPILRPKAGQSTAEGYAAGEDQKALIAGSPDTVAAKVQELADLGINHLLLRFAGEWTGETRQICETSLKLFSEEVIPRFSGMPR